jgi:TPP-dependent pyruvate/acetoin dehydrogenase alpha subunit
VEQEIARVYPTDKIKSPVHLSIGQEATSVGVCEALEPQDIVFGTYRSHALYLAKGGDLNRMIAELYGKVSGVARGKGGSMHLIDTKKGVMGTSAIVATTIPQAVGYAYALKIQRKDTIVASFFGDGAVEEGAFHESMNFASLKRLPIVFVCENNFYAIHSHQRDRQCTSNIAERALSYGMPAQRIEDGGVVRIYEAVKQATKEIRAGSSGPHFFECLAYRWMEHVGPREDFDSGFRSRKEAEPWFENDQVKLIGGFLAPEVRRRVEAEVEAEIREAFAFAEESSFPADDELYAHVFDGE